MRLSGGQAIAPSAADKWRFGSVRGRVGQVNPIEANLTATQRETLALMARGLSNVEIASQRMVSLTTVTYAVGQVYQGLGLSGDKRVNKRVRAVLMFLRWKRAE